MGEREGFDSGVAPIPDESSDGNVVDLMVAIGVSVDTDVGATGASLEVVALDVGTLTAIGVSVRLVGIFAEGTDVGMGPSRSCGEGIFANTAARE